MVLHEWFPTIYTDTLDDIIILQRKPLALIKSNVNLFYDLSNCQTKYSFCLDRIFYPHYLWDTEMSEKGEVLKFRQTRPRFKSLCSTFELCHLGKVT